MDSTNTVHNSSSGEEVKTLGRLCRYYLQCLGLDDDAGVSVFADSKYDLDYSELTSLPESIHSESPQPISSASLNLLARLKRHESRKSPYLGYPVRLRRHTGRNGWTGFFVEPVFLIALAEDAAFAGRGLRPTEDVAAINLALLKSLSFGDPSDVMQESALLADQLGLWEHDAPGLVDLASRLFTLRPDWDWKEQPEPASLNSGCPLRGLNVQGIYNRAVLVGVERSTYTKGLEAELSQLIQVDESDLSQTALGHWLTGNPGECVTTTTDDIGSLIEPLPLNQEQRAACTSALTRRLTVVTGPPGTGKSQLVSALLVNAVTRSKRVLFASKNHKAVDVVESRVNALGPRPVLLRLGRGTYQNQLADYLASLLGSQTSDEDRRDYSASRASFKETTDSIRECKAAAERVMELRNSVDDLEQQAEAARTHLGPALFAKSQKLNPTELKSTCESFAHELQRATRKSQPLLARLFWPLIRQRRFRAFADALKQMQPMLESAGLPHHQPPAADEDVADPIEFQRSSSEQIQAIETASQYHALRSSLAEVESIEEHHARLAILHDTLAETSSALWEAWLRMVPSRLTREDRDNLGNLLAVLRLIIESQSAGDNAGRSLYAKFYALFPRVANILPAWAVTALSAKGRIPFEPGFFDLLVIDEASQCDIASALPLLYRAKAAVIIGDPQQLQHISNISTTRDTHLLLGHDLLATEARWSFSANSLFGLASSLAAGGDVTMLMDHHRSHPDIIGFSNEYFYQRKLRVATNLNGLRTPAETTAVRWIDVTGSVTSPSGSGAVNILEAKKVIEELERLFLQQGYKGSVGVVTPFRAQANLINKLVSDHPHSTLFGGVSDFLCDTVHRFQGDERDIMIFSLVYGQGISPGATGFLSKTGNLFNVAITRARAVLIIVGDWAAASHSKINHLQEFARYVRQHREHAPDADVQPTTLHLTASYPAVARPQQVSEWERTLYRELFAAGLKPLPQFPVEKYVLDFALFDGQRRLDLEVDGVHYHRRWDGELLYRDQLRNLRLIELGWDVMRFWVYELRDNMPGCVAKVRAWLEAHGRGP
jgi:very-short-patch-repair endonuclease